MVPVLRLDFEAKMANSHEATSRRDQSQELVPSCLPTLKLEYLTIIPRAQMGYESIAHEGERNNCFSKIQLVGQKNIEAKHLSLVKARL